MLCERCGGQYEAGKDSHLCVLPSGDDLAKEIEAWFRTTRGLGLLGFAEWERKHPKK